MIYTEQSGTRPTEIFRANSGGGTGVALTHLNDFLLSGTQLMPLEELWVEGAARLHDRAVWTRQLSADAGAYKGSAWQASRLQP